MPRLCAFGCSSKGTIMHRFPDAKKYPDRFKAWVTLVGGKLVTETDFEHFKKKMVCDKHFTQNDKNRNHRLNNSAIPSLYLSGTPMNESESASDQVTVEETTPTLCSTTTHSEILLPDNIGSRHQFSIAEYVQTEHNYSVISKSRDDSRKVPLKESVRRTSKVFQKDIRMLRLEISRLRKKTTTFKARLANAEKLAENTAFQQVAEKMSSTSQLFMHMQLQNVKKSKGRRFTIEEKVLCLSLFKKSPKCYKLLHKYFTLPSIKAMQRLISQIKVCPGINPIIFKKLKATVLDIPVNDRLCSLIFDEMSLTPQVSYDAHKDSLEGFSTNKTTEFADHALVFMIKGIKSNFKQPVAYYFTTKLNKLELKTVIKEVIINCQNAGLIVINTVCDQSTVNVSAISDMVSDTKALFLKNGKEWRHDVIRVNKRNIIPLYDVPHLIKGIRNNLLNKDMSYEVDNEIYVVKWEYFQKLYAADTSYGELRLLDKITEEHINPEKINKMRVKCATQIFSHSVAVAAEHLTGRGNLPIECKQLIKITLLLDNLFDSLNVNSFNPINGKKYKGAVRRNSCHHQLWRNAKQILKTIRFREKKFVGNKIRLTEKVVPSVTNFIKTIEGMEAIWDVLSKKYGFDTLFTRNFNQDPAENFFGNVRSFGGRNNAPNSVAFQGAFKALLLNNYNSPHSNRSNCEEDNNKCLQSLHFFLDKEIIETSDVPTHEGNVFCNEDIFDVVDFNNEIDAGQRNYVCGWVLTKCLKNVAKGCKQCKEDLLDNKNDNESNAFIKAKEYANKKWLCYPNKYTEHCFHEIQNIIISFLKKDAPKTNVKKNICAFINLLVNFPFKCQRHNEVLKEYFTNITLNVVLHSWCRSVNRILSGKIKYEGEDEIKTAAQLYYDKHKHYKNKK
ncbi:transposable element P transposase isoform X2 [Amyelois transitella]|uniref:transposable element P transposase isoform X2 n=1 Tax=Amyelois transitella TaxID=680683 RepID=UPI00298FD291|nr:transposable element P transposase isoform X2 [Amyelois transitella]XP_060806060.1 transposable element P transposase isoform X2 [Amyelois transitella]